MRDQRDTQRSRVYAWERSQTSRHTDRPLFKTLDEVEAWAAPIWRAERGRLGLARATGPIFARNLWGCRRATAAADRTVKLPLWARSPWVILHELAHLLTPHDEAHGARFVGVLMGLVCRYDGRDAAKLMASADEQGVRYHVRSIGAVPVTALVDQLAALAPMLEVEAAIELGLTWRQVRGVVLASRGALRLRGHMVVQTRAAG